MLVAEIRAGRCTAVRDAGLIARHALDHIVVDVFLDGGFAGSLGTRTVTLDAGDGVTLDLAEPASVLPDAAEGGSGAAP